MECVILEVLKADLDSLPEEEAVFLTVMLHLTNEINFLQKAALASKPDSRLPDPIEDSAQNSQILFFLKLLAGKLYEGWRTLEKAYFRAGLSRNYDNRLPEISKKALSDLKTYFGKSDNLIEDVRNKYGFHTDVRRVSESLRSLPKSEPLRVVAPSSLGNIFAQFAEALTNLSVVRAVQGVSLEEATKRLMTEVLLTVPMYFQNFAHGFAEVALGQCQVHRTKHEIEVKELDSVYLPYFLEKK